MSTAKHKPGPWAYTVNAGSDLCVKDSTGEFVVSGCGCCGSPNCDEEDARLIAAAPELLEACQTVKAAIEAGAIIDASTLNGLLLSRVNSSIAKATGSAA